MMEGRSATSISGIGSSASGKLLTDCSPAQSWHFPGNHISSTYISLVLVNISATFVTVFTSAICADVTYFKMPTDFSFHQN